jgi:hypothetical protein
LEQRLIATLRRSNAGVFLALSVLCWLCFAGALRGHFLAWDDTHHFALNPWLTAHDWLHFWKRPYYGFYIPASYSIWSWMWSVSENPVTFHVFNLLLHILNSYMVFRLVPKLFPGADRTAALIAATVFAIHPMQVESVAWISGGRDLMSAFFALLACHQLLGLSPWLSLPLFALSLLAKPQLFALPLALFWLVPERRKVLAGWIAFSAISAGLAIWVQNEFAQSRFDPLAIWRRPVVALDALGFYVAKIASPWPLMADYGRKPALVFSQHLYFWSIPVLAVLGFFLHRMREIPDIRRGALFSGLILLPVLGLISFSGQEQSTVYDRYMYFAMIGPGVMIASLPKRKWVSYARTMALVAWAMMCVYRSPVWVSDRSLSEDMVANNPNSYGGLTNLANVELNDGNLDRAIELLRRAIELKPKLSVAISNLAYAFWLKKDLQSIFREIEPLLNNNDFLSANTTEREGLALMYRMTARAHWTLLHRDDAKAAYCKAVRIYPIDPYLKAEVDTILKEMAEACP